MKSKLKNYFIATRPWSFPASTMPALITFTYIFYIHEKISGNINWWYGIIAIIGAAIFQASSNLINDYFDYKYQVDRPESFGSSRLLVEKVFTPKFILSYGFVLLGIGVLLGLFLWYKTGNALLWIGIIGTLAAVLYSKLKYVALGDLIIFIIYGPLIGLGTAYVMTQQLLWKIILINIPIAFLVVNILHANNTRDIRDDNKAHIKTQAMVLGLKRAKIQYVTLAVGAYVMIALLIILRIIHPIVLLVFLTVPLTIKNIRQMQTAQVEKPELIKDLDAKSAQLVLLFGLIFSVCNTIGNRL